MNKKLLKDLISTIISDKQMVMNSLSEEDKAKVQEVIDALTALAEQVDAMEDTEDNEEAKTNFNDAVASIQEQITALTEKINLIQTQPEEMKENTENYLNTRQSLVDFYHIATSSKSAKEVRNAWNAKLVENGITPAEGSEDFLLPAAISGAIMDAWERPGNWLKELKNTGLKSYKIRTVTTDGNDEDARAKGHKKGDDKDSQDLDVITKVLNLQSIYKLMELPHLDVVNDDEGQLVKYLADEIYRQLLVEAQRAILVGDGRASNSDYKINSFEAINRSATDTYVTVNTYDGTNQLLTDVITTVNAVENVYNDKVYAFMSKQTLLALRTVQFGEDSTVQYNSPEVVAEMIGVDAIITTTLLGDDVKMVAFCPKSYVTIGNLTAPEYREGFAYKTNTDWFLGEIFAGGAMEQPLGAAVLLDGTSDDEE